MLQPRPGNGFTRSKGLAYGLMLIGLSALVTGCPAFVALPPVASFTASPLSGEAPLTVNFDASASSDPDATIASYSWNFGDSSTGTGQTPSHQYTADGTFQVTLTVTDTQGLSDSTSLFISVGQSSIYFASDRNTAPNFQIFKMNTDGTAQAQVTSTPGADNLFPALVPNTRNQLALASDRDTPGFFDIFRGNPDGTLLANLTATQTASHEIQPSWMPDGTQIVYASDVTGDWEIWIMNADGTGKTNLSSSPTSNELAPAVSPDGTKITFASDQDGDFEILVMNIDGTGVTQLTSNVGINDGAVGTDFFGILPLGAGPSRLSWSPDGTKIAYASDQNTTLDLFSINADGTGVTLLTPNVANDYDPFWLPNGTEIAFVSDRAGGFALHIWKLDVSSLAAVQLTTLGLDNISPGAQKSPVGRGKPR